MAALLHADPPARACPSRPVQAAAAGGDQAAGLAEATAVAICSGGASATAYSEAYSVAVSQNPDGCTVLTEVSIGRYWFRTCSRGLVA